jgi:hypothetical protein
MKRHYLTSVTALALALGMSAAGAQNVDQRRNTDQGRQTDQVERSQQPQTSGQSQNMPSHQQGSDQENRQGTQNQQSGQLPQQNPPSTTGQNATDRQQGDRQPEQRLNQGSQQQNAPATSGPPQQGAQEPRQGQNQQQPQQGQNQQQGAQGERQDGEKQQGAKNEQPDKSGRIALDVREQTLVSDIIRQQRIQPVTNINFSLSVGSRIPSSVRLSRISGELAEIFPHYRDFSFFVAKQELVIVDSQSYGIVAFVPISGGGTVGMAPPREETGAVGTAAPPAPDKKKAVRTEKKRVTVTEKPRVIKRETVRRRQPDTETDVTVGTSRRDIDEFDRLPSRDRRIGPPVRERFERDEGPPFPFPFPLFGSPN